MLSRLVIKSHKKECHLQQHGWSWYNITCMQNLTNTTTYWMLQKRRKLSEIEKKSSGYWWGKERREGQYKGRD